MLHIRPVLEKDASEKVGKVYEEIKSVFNIHFVPLVFQYIAGFEDYLVYAWDKYKENIESDYFTKATDEITHLSLQSIAAVYRQSREMHHFVSTLPAHEKDLMQQTATELLKLNSQLLILTIGLREGVKGVVIGRQVLPQHAGEYEETVFDQFINEKIMHANLKAVEKDVIPAQKMLAPLFGSSSLVVSKYPAFFAHVAREMEHLSATEKYLHERVLMEQHALQKALHLPYPLGCSYSEIATFAGKKPYFSELLYILSETFPTSFPRLVFTSSLMQLVLHPRMSTSLVE